MQLVVRIIYQIYIDKAVLNVTLNEYILQVPCLMRTVATLSVLTRQSNVIVFNSNVQGFDKPTLL
jgi:hypothetical protein